MNRAADELIELIGAELQQPVPPGARALAERVIREGGTAVQAVLFYGSNLRRRDDSEGVLDLYVLVDRYRRYYRNPLLSIANVLLPPNVFYAETQIGGGRVRAKYAVVALGDFARHTSTSCFHSYFWGRFAQPCALIYARDPAAAEAVARAVAGAVVTLLRRGIPLLPRRFEVGELWTAVLRQSYRAELRTEGVDTPRRLYEADAERYARVTRAALAALPFPAAAHAEAEATWVEAEVPRSTRLATQLGWRLRRAQGKLLSVLRLLKGALTFDGGVEYILWKIERHSGVKVDPSEIEGRHRLLALGGVFWRLYRKGAFR